MFRQTSGTSQPWWVATCPVGSVIRRGMFRTHNVRQHLRGLWRSLQSQANGCVFSKILYPLDWREEIGIFFFFPSRILKICSPAQGTVWNTAPLYGQLPACCKQCMISCPCRSHMSAFCISNVAADLMLLQISFLCRSHVSLHHLSAYALKKLSADNAFSYGKEVIYHP